MKKEKRSQFNTFTCFYPLSKKQKTGEVYWNYSIGERKSWPNFISSALDGAARGKKTGVKKT
ncbi:MAG: hypothetical protein ACLQGU_20440 [bacterium]